jgi:hypothetical protein
MEVGGLMKCGGTFVKVLTDLVSGKSVCKIFIQSPKYIYVRHFVNTCTLKHNRFSRKRDRFYSKVVSFLLLVTNTPKYICKTFC